MLFFDDDPYNIQDVARLGVTCVETPEGASKDEAEKKDGKDQKETKDSKTTPGSAKLSEKQKAALERLRERALKPPPKEEPKVETTETPEGGIEQW
eukprot:symbB.v1.2.018554.t1/scaffold1483.1/size116006/3